MKTNEKAPEGTAIPKTSACEINQDNTNTEPGGKQLLDGNLVRMVQMMRRKINNEYQDQ